MSRHLTDEELIKYALRSLANTVRLQQHLFKCGDCLRRLVELEATVLADRLARTPEMIQLADRPLFICHETAEGMVYCRAEKCGHGWRAHRWGTKGEAGRRFRFVSEANQDLISTFREMYPEHRCTRRCRLNPRLNALSPFETADVHLRR